MHCPRGPPGKKWDISPTKILSMEVKDYGFALSGKNGFPQAINEESLMLTLRIHVAFQAIPEMRVESVYLEFKGNRLPSTWEPAHINVGVTHSSYIYFRVPK